MEIVRHPIDDVAGFAALVRPLLDPDPVRHTVVLSVLDGLVRGGERPALLLTVHDGGAVIGAALRTPGRLLQVSGVPASAVVALAAELARTDPALPGASGPVVPARAFADTHAAHTGALVRVGMPLRLFTLDELVPPDVRGAARLADLADVDLVAARRLAMVEELDGHWDDPATPREVAERMIRLGRGEIVWEVDGTPVASASASRPVAGMSRIGAVYTPPEHRGHGYAAAATAVASRWALDAGARHVVLFTDAGNEATNRLYPRLGYRFVLDAVDLRFDRQNPA